MLHIYYSLKSIIINHKPPCVLIKKEIKNPAIERRGLALYSTQVVEESFSLIKRFISSEALGSLLIDSFQGSEKVAMVRSLGSM